MAIGWHRLATQLGRQLDDGVLRRADECAAEVDGRARDGRCRRPAADPVTALHHDDVVSEPDEFPRRGQAGEPGPDDDDVGVGWVVTRLGSHAVKVMTALFGPINAIEQAQALREAGANGVFTFEGTNDVFAPLTLASTVGGLDLMTNVAIAFPRNPIHLAHQAIDHQLLSEGRFALGLGTQIRTQIEKRFGAQFDKPVARMTELIAALRAIFESWATGERLDFRGEYYRHTLMTPTFSPGENPYGPPPIYVGALGPRLTRATAEHADGLLVMPFGNKRFLHEVTMPAVRDGLAAAGKCARRSPDDSR